MIDSVRSCVWKEAVSNGKLWRSLYFRWAIYLTLLLAPLWLQPGWWEQSISILSILIGFSVAAYSLLLAFGNREFQKLLSAQPAAADQAPAFMRMSAAFLFFITVQMSGLCAALFSQAWFFEDFWKMHVEIKLIYWPLWLISFFLFCYSLTCAMNAARYIYKMTEMFVALENRIKNDKKSAEE